MTFERKIVVSLDEITTIIFECSCDAKTAYRPEDIVVPPTRCPNGHAWNWDVPLERQTITAPMLARLLCLKILRLESSKKYGFTIFMEFKDQRV